MCWKSAWVHREGDIQWFYRTTTEGQYGGFRPECASARARGRRGEGSDVPGRDALGRGQAHHRAAARPAESEPGTTPMQNMEPTLRPNNPMIAGHNPDLYPRC